MNKEQQRITIAKACGWKYITPSQICGYAPWRKQYAPQDIPIDGTLPFDILPDYLNDLNAMHEAEKTLKDKSEILHHTEQFIYRRHLVAICGKGGAYVATAAQRAEAFLKTLDLWIE